MKCKDIMSHDIKWCFHHSTVKEAVSLMEEQNCGAIPVVDESMKLKGIVTDRDIALFVILRDKNPETTRLDEFMSKDVITCSGEDSMDELISKMKYYQVRRVPVVDSEGRLEGMIALGDIAVKAPEEEHMTYEALEKISEPIHK